MVLIVIAMKYTPLNDNETFTFQTLAGATAKVTAKLDASKLSIETEGRLGIGAASFFRSCKMPKVETFPILGDSSAPSLPIPSPSHAFKSGSVSLLLSPIGLVEAGSHLPKIAQPIVCGISVDVINPHPRPFPVDMQPCEPMSLIAPPANYDRDVALPETAGDVARACPTRHTDLPAHDPGNRAIIEQSTNLVGRDHSKTPNDGEGKHDDKSRDQEREEFVSRRVRDISAFERRASGNRKRGE